MTVLSGIIFILLEINFQLVFCKNILEKPFEVANNQSEEYQLIFAQIISRHGDRNIFRGYPLDPYKDARYWPGGYAALTKLGRQEQYELGKYLRRRYKKLVGEQYSPENVYIRSSDTDRNLMSAQCLAAGMFPPSENEIWNKDLNWQPIPIHTISLNDDYNLNHEISCPRYDQLFKEFTESTTFKYQMKRYDNLIEFLRLNTGRTLPNSVQVLYMFALLKEERDKGFVLPNWVDDIARYTNDTLEQICAAHMEAFTHTNEMKKFKAGFFIKEIFDRFKKKSLSLLEPDYSLWIYSAHDINIVNLLNTLNLYELHMPPFSSSLFFELYRQNDDYFIQIFYRKTPTENVPPLNIPKCAEMCPLEKFYELYEHILPTNSEDVKSLCYSST